MSAPESETKNESFLLCCGFLGFCFFFFSFFLNVCVCVYVSGLGALASD